MNGYPQYGHYGQPPINQSMYYQGPMQAPPGPHGYPQFYPPHPSQMQQPGGMQPGMQPGMQHSMQGGQPAPVPSFDAEAYANMQANAGGGTGSKKHKKRSASASASIPLKSAMKKNPQITATPLVNSMEFPQQYSNGFSLSRQRTNSFGRSNNPDARKRADSNVYSNHDHVQDPPFQPLHMFISFDGLNGLKLENITDLALKELRERIWRMWPDGVESVPASHSEVYVKFRNQPWDMSGPNHLVALKMLQELFTLCCRRGYVFQTAINTGHQQTPRLIFQVESPDPHSTFFLGYLSSSGKRITVMNAPNPVELALYMTLQRMLPRKLHSELVQVSHDTNLRHIEVKRGADVSPGLFLAHILKTLNELGYELDFSIPLQRRQSLGMSRVAQEVLVFKSYNIG